MHVIPAIDLLGGRCVRLYQGDFGKVTEYDTDPVALAGTFSQAGATRLHLVDLDGAKSGTPANLDIVREITRHTGIAVQAGGGVRTRAAADALFAAGADRVVVGSVAISEPATVIAWLDAAGADRFVLAFDVKLNGAGGEPMAVTHGWQKASGKRLWDLLDEFLAAGARDFLCTDVARDGTLSGPNNALYAECVRRYPAARIIASGGISGAADFPALAATGVDAVVTGKALLDGRLTLAEVRQFSRGG